MATPRLVALAMSLGFVVASQAQVVVENPWVRATVPNQQATGAFFRMTSKQDATLVSARSDIAGVVEVHEMKMEQGIMKMRPVENLRFQAGQTIEFKSGGYHLMLMDLKKQVKSGSEVQISLVFEGAQGQRETVYVHAPVRISAPAK